MLARGAIDRQGEVNCTFLMFFFWPGRAEWDSILPETRFFVGLAPGTAQWSVVPQAGLSHNTGLSAAGMAIKKDNSGIKTSERALSY